LPTITDPARRQPLLPEEPADDRHLPVILDGQTWHHQLPTLPLQPGAGARAQRHRHPGLAAQTARRLTRLGFHVTGTGDAAATSTTTVTTRARRRPTAPTR